MPTASTSRRITNAKTTKGSTTTNDVDDLTRKLALKLTVSNPKQKAPARQSPEERRNDAMRMVNSTSQSFSAWIQSGWRVSERKKSSDMNLQSPPNVKSSAAAMRASLQLLRDLSSLDVNVERAALSAAGKLIVLELYDSALDLLVDMHSPLLLLYIHEASDVSQSKSSKTKIARTTKLPQRGHVLSLPLPSEIPDAPLLKLITTYLLHSLIAFTSSLFSANPDQLNDFADILTQSTTLNAWVPLCSSLPRDYLDSICTRTYMALTKSSGSTTQFSQKAVFDIRIYSLRCLGHASPSVIKPDTFWDQATKFGVLFIKGNRSDETFMSRTILSAFSSLVDEVQQLPDNGIFLSGNGFVKFCDYWTGFARKNGDITTLERVSGLMNNIPSCSTTPMGVDSGRDSAVIDAAKICAILAQTTAQLEHILSSSTVEQHDDMHKRLFETNDIVRRSVPFLISSARGDDQTDQTATKVGRAVERLRRMGLKILESSTSPQLVSQMGSLLECLVDALESATSQTGSEETRASLLDTLFALSRNLLNTTNPDTYMPAYAILEKALRIVNAEPSSNDSRPNYLRCVSGAFYSLGGHLYQAGRYGAAARFLQDACTIGKEALTLWRLSVNATEAQSAGDVWDQLQDQLHKRWELLGVCLSRMDDRSRACGAFVQSIQMYPFNSEPFASLLLNMAPQSLFDVPKHRQIGAIIDRVTYMGVFDLFKPPSQISLKNTMYPSCEMNARFEDIIIGAILERQIDGLEGSIWKENVRDLVNKLLEDALEVYGDRWPIRKARILLRCLEFSYYAGPGNSHWITDDIMVQIENLLKQQNFGEDSPAAHFRSQYIASAHLWMTLHAHRREDPQQVTLVVRHAEEAGKILRTLIASSGNANPQARKATKASPTKVAGAKTRPVRKPKKPPITPKQRKTLEPASPKVVHKTPPRQPPGGIPPKTVVPFDQFHRLASLLQTTTQLLGLLGHVLTKVHLLTVTRRLIEHNAESNTDDYVRISVDLAHEYVKLGRMERASAVYSQTLSIVRNSTISGETRVSFSLRFAESLAIVGNVLQSSTMYCEAQVLSETITTEDKSMSTASRVYTRVGCLERAAMAAHTFALIQYYNDDPTTSLKALLQSLRLYNRAVESLARFNPLSVPHQEPEEDNPFATAGTKEAQDPKPHQTSSHRKTPMNGLEWRISEGLLVTLFALAQAYFARGSAREAEYFAQQAQDLAESINTPAMVSRALSRKGEIYLHLGRLDEGYECIVKAADLINGMSITDAADIRRLHGDYNQRSLKNRDAQQLYEEAMNMLEELQKLFAALDGVSSASDVRPRKTSKVAENDTLLPTLLAAVLRQHIWLLRDEDAVEESEVLLSKFRALPPSAETKAEENGLMAKLALHGAYARFRADMFLSSLAESTIALPMGMTGDRVLSSTPGTQEISTTLNNAEKLFWSDLALITRRGQVPQVREAAVSLALIRAFQTSLGKAGMEGPILSARLLDASTTITLRREMVETIQAKFPDVLSHDDLQWPLITQNGSPLPPPKRKVRGKPGGFNSTAEENVDLDDPSCKTYWETIAQKYRSFTLDMKSLSASQTTLLPRNWTVINMTVTEDKSTMFISRQNAQRQPIVFCVPLKGRRESEGNAYLTFNDAIEEFKKIIHLSDEATKKAVNVKDDKQARSNWWTERSALDVRLRELLENIEFCWLGAFKTILSEMMDNPEDVLSSFRARLEGVFQRSLVSLDKKQLNRVKLDDSLLECFATLSPKCRDEELEDLIYFILDLYQCHGIPVAIAEVDIDQLTVDLRNILEEHVAATQARIAPVADNHTFLILDKNVEGLPWESIPILRGRSVSRIPNMDFLLDRLDLAKQQRQRARLSDDDIPNTVVDRAVVDPKKTFYLLNPSGDLKGTEGRFSEWLIKMGAVGWRGLTSKPPSEQQFLNALLNQDLVLYFGHGGGEQYIRSHKIRHLPRCAATMLWGCSSGAMKDMGEFDRIGTPYNYMLAGCPTLVANIWDVTDRDIDKFAQSVFDKMKMTKENVGKWVEDVEVGKISLVTAVARSRDSCKLKYLTGAAPVVYGIPFYL